MQLCHLPIESRSKDDSKGFTVSICIFHVYEKCQTSLEWALRCLETLGNGGSAVLVIEHEGWAAGGDMRQGQT